MWSGAIDPEFNDVGLWIELAKTREEATVDGIFDTIVEEGPQLPSNSLQSHPFTFARQVSTLDHLSGGRASWNIVTGWQNNGARNFGLQSLPEHDSRYEWAEEYVDVAYTLWEGSWDEGALPYQAGSSPAGRAFAARHAEGVFLIADSLASAVRQIDQTRALAVETGRRPDDLTFFPGLSFIIGDTEDEAQRKAEYVHSYISVAGLLAHLAVVDDDGQAYPLDTPLSQVRTQAMQGSVERARSCGSGWSGTIC